MCRNVKKNSWRILKNYYFFYFRPMGKSYKNLPRKFSSKILDGFLSKTSQSYDWSQKINRNFISELNQMLCVYIIARFNAIMMKRTDLFPLRFDSELWWASVISLLLLFEQIKSRGFFCIFIKIQRCPICTYSSPATFTLNRQCVKCRFAKLSHNRPSIAKWSYTVLPNI